MNKFDVASIVDLMTFSKEYFEECLHTKSGFNIIYMVEHSARGFDMYLSTSHELGPMIKGDLSRNESLENIIHTVDCSLFTDYDNVKISEMAYQMGFLLFGAKCGEELFRKYKLVDDTPEFEDKVSHFK